MKILITGSNGLLGQKLIKRCLKDDDITPIATSRGADRYQESKIEYHSLDITKAGEVSDLMYREKPDVVINTAAMTNVDQCEDEKENCRKINVEAVENMIRSTNEIDAFLLHLSTDFIFDGKEKYLKETSLPNPVNYYGQTKLESENLIREESKHWAIARTILVYGVVPDISRSNLILWVKSKLEKGESISVVDDQWRTPTLAEDLAEGCYLIAKNRSEGIWNISGSELLTPYEMAMETAEYFKLDPSLIQRTTSDIFRQKALRPSKTGFDIEKARTELGYSPHTFKEGLEIVANQLKE